MRQMAQKNPSKEFEERKALIDLQKSCDLEKHQLRMKELEYMRESDLLRHNQEMERQRIKSAEIRKMQERKEFANMRKYG